MVSPLLFGLSGTTGEEDVFGFQQEAVVEGPEYESSGSMLLLKLLPQLKLSEFP